MKLIYFGAIYLNCIFTGDLPVNIKELALKLVRAFCPLVADKAFPDHFRCLQKKDFEALFKETGHKAKWQLAILNNIARICCGHHADTTGSSESNVTPNQVYFGTIEINLICY